MVESDLPPTVITYRPGGNEIVNNGHTIQMNYAPGSTIKVSGHEFELKQVHFHSPSENRIEGHPTLWRPILCTPNRKAILL